TPLVPARWKLVAVLPAVDLLVADHLDEVDLLLHALDHAGELVLRALFADLDVAPVVRGDLGEDLGRDLDAFVEEDLAGVVGEPGGGGLALEALQHLLSGSLAHDAYLT